MVMSSSLKITPDLPQLAGIHKVKPLTFITRQALLTCRCIANSTANQLRMKIQYSLWLEEYHNKFSKALAILITSQNKIEEQKEISCLV